jgi:hypothetical protein
VAVWGRRVPGKGVCEYSLNESGCDNGKATSFALLTSPRKPASHHGGFVVFWGSSGRVPARPAVLSLGRCGCLRPVFVGQEPVLPEQATDRFRERLTAVGQSPSDVFAVFRGTKVA